MLVARPPCSLKYRGICVGFFSFLWFGLQIERSYIGILLIIYVQDRDANIALEI